MVRRKRRGRRSWCHHRGPGDVARPPASVNPPAFGNYPVIPTDEVYKFSGRLDTFGISLANDTEEIISDNQPSLDYYLKKRMLSVRNTILKDANKAFINEETFFYY